MSTFTTGSTTLESVEIVRLGVRHLFYSSSLGWICRSPHTNTVIEPVTYFSKMPSYIGRFATTQMVSQRTDYLRKSEDLYSDIQTLKLPLTLNWDTKTFTNDFSILPRRFQR